MERQAFLVTSGNHDGRKSSEKMATIHSIGLEDFEQEVLHAPLPVLVLCMHPDPEFQGQLEVIADTCGATEGNNLKVCLLKEESVGVFGETYGVGGTPTFLLFKDGKEMNRLLGQAEPDILKAFLSQTLAEKGGE